jgi:hypothetical protein
MPVRLLDQCLLGEVDLHRHLSNQWNLMHQFHPLDLVVLVDLEDSRNNYLNQSHWSWFVD